MILEAILKEFGRIHQVREAYDHPNKNIQVAPLLDKVKTAEEMECVFNILTQQKYADVVKRIHDEAHSESAAFAVLYTWCRFVLEMVFLQDIPFVQPDFDEDGIVIMEWRLAYAEGEGYIERSSEGEGRIVLRFWPSSMIHYALWAPTGEQHEGTMSVSKMITIIKLYRNKIKEEENE